MAAARTDRRQGRQTKAAVPQTESCFVLFPEWGRRGGGREGGRSRGWGVWKRREVRSVLVGGGERLVVSEMFNLPAPRVAAAIMIGNLSAYDASYPRVYT